jgi:hypothetical protein
MGIFVNFCAGGNLGTLSGLRPTGILVNTLHNASTESQVKATLKLFEEKRPEYTYLDCGGYQLQTKEQNGVAATHDKSLPMFYSKERVNIAANHVIEAAVKLDVDMMTSLDFPIRQEPNPYLKYADFSKKLGWNLVGMRETILLGRKFCPDKQIFVPVQCYDIRQFDDYFAQPLMDLGVSCLSLPANYMGPEGISLFLIRFYQFGIRKVHILGSVSFINLALAAYFARNIFDWVSVDATTWRIQADNQLYIDPLDLHPITVGRNAGLEVIDLALCPCPWCSRRTYVELINTSDTERTSILRCHNFHVIEKAGRDFYNNSGDLITFERHLRGRTRSVRKHKEINQLISALQVATHMRDVDIQVSQKLLLAA